MDAPIVFGLASLGWLYWRGTTAVWRVAGRDRGVRTWQACVFALGFVAVGVALLSPLDALADKLFAAHMAQHLLLIVVAAPLLAVADPVVALLWAWPQRTRVSIGRALARVRSLMGRVRVLTTLPVAFWLHSLAVWGWHVPALYEGALRSAPLHATEHLVLLGSGILFWSLATRGVFHADRVSGASVVYVLGLGAQSTALGALITFASQPWYAFYVTAAPGAGLSASDDQMLAGVLMWVPAGFVYLGFGLVLLGAWLRPAPRSAAQS